MVSLFNVSVFLISRNSFWISHPGQAWLATDLTAGRLGVASEFERNLSCYVPTVCLRSGYSFIFQPLIFLSTELLDTIFEITNKFKTQVIFFFGLFLRLSSIFIFGLLTSRIFKSKKCALLITNSVLLVVGGLPILMTGSIIIFVAELMNFPHQRLSLAINYMSFSNLLFYDYALFGFVPGIILMSKRVLRRIPTSKSQFFLVGFVVSLFYESFVLMITVALLLIRRPKARELTDIFFLFLGQLCVVLLTIIRVHYSEISNPDSPYFFSPTFTNVVASLTSNSPNSENFESFLSIFGQYCLLGFVALGIGFATGLASHAFSINFSLSRNCWMVIKTSTISVVLVTLLSYIRPVQIETGRQSLGFLISLVILSFAYSQVLFTNKNSKVI